MAMFFHSSSVGVSMDVPPTQNTAPVLEYRCLYTPDLRRKQKRWQDGRLKFHTFNKRVMVYDERANFVGDAHYREDFEFGEGVELGLERGGIIVEVGECIGVKQQDLTELVDKRLKEKEERAAVKTASRTPLGQSMRKDTFHAPVLHPKSLNLLCASNGQRNRAAISGLSPFQERQREALGSSGGHENERPAKRRRQDDLTSSQKGYAQALLGATLSLSSQRPSHKPILRYEQVTARQSVNSETTSSVFDSREQRALGPDQSAATENPLLDVPQSTTRKRVQRLPPHRTAYAANPTGAALSLSRPESLVSKPANNGGRTERFQTLETQSQLQDSSNLGNSRLLLATVQQPRNDVTPAERITHNPRTGPLSSSRLSSPDSHRRPPRDSISQNDPGQPAISCASVAGVAQTSPVSSLIIKARPPRKLMMLMQPPISISRAPNQSSQKSQALTKRASNNKVDSAGIVLSQATADLNSFCQKQEAILSARLTRISTYIQAQEREAQFSSPVSIGSTNPQSRHRSAQATETNDLTTSPNDASPSLSRTSLASEVKDRAINQSQKQLQGESVPEKLRILKREVSRPDDTIRDLTRSLEDPSSQERDMSQSRQRPASPGAVRSGLQVATNYFRDLVASTTHSLGHVKEVDSQLLELQLRVLQNRVPNTQPTGLDLDSNQKTSISQALIMGVPRAESSVIAGYESSPVFDLTGISDLIAPQTQISDNQSSEETKPRLVNPATRGKNLQTLTSLNLTEIPAPALNSIAIPPQFAVKRREATNARCRDMVAAAATTTAAPTDIGPWSRESFDLFGTWKQSNLKEQNLGHVTTDVSTIITT